MYLERLGTSIFWLTGNPSTVQLLHAHWNLIVSFTSCHHQSKLENVAAKMFARYMEAGHSPPNGRCHGFGEKVFGFDHLEGPSHCANLPLWVILGRFQIVWTESLVVFGSIFGCDWGMWGLLEMAFLLFHKESRNLHSVRQQPWCFASVVGRPFWRIKSLSPSYAIFVHILEATQKAYNTSIDIIDDIRICLMINWLYHVPSSHWIYCII